MWDSLRHCINEAIKKETIPGIAVSVRMGTDVLFEEVSGSAQLIPTCRDADADTIWDVASLTKVLCTTPLFLYFHDNNIINIDDHISDFIPEAPNGVTIADILSHSSGLPAWTPFYDAFLNTKGSWKSGQHRQQIFNQAIQTPLTTTPGQTHRYSDIGFIILGAVIEKCSGLSLEQAFGTLPIAATTGLTWGTTSKNTAATEDCPIRKQIISGTVHDLNADAMGGIAPHAGLFGTLSDVANALHWPLDIYHKRSDVIKRSSLIKFWTTRGSGSHVLGWDTPSGARSSASELWPTNGVGHLGFTGCSSWLAPTLDLSVTILSNRIHPLATGGVLGGFNNPKYVDFKKLRRDIHREIIKIWL